MLTKAAPAPTSTLALLAIPDYVNQQCNQDSAESEEIDLAGRISDGDYA